MKIAIITLKVIHWDGKASDRKWRVECADDMTAEQLENQIHECAPMGMETEIVSIEFVKPSAMSL